MKHLFVVGLAALTFAVGVSASAAAQSERLQEGVSVQLAITRNAASVPDADNPDALIVTVTDSGSIYFGVEPTNPAALTETIKSRFARRVQKVYIKADARTQYASVVKVLDAARTAGVEAPILLTAQPDWSKPGTIVPPKGLEVTIDPSASGSDATVVQVLDSGHKRPAVKINNRDIPWGHIQHTLEQLFRHGSEKVVLVKADELLPFAPIVHVIDACRAAGATVVLAGS